MPPAKGGKISWSDESLVTALMIESKISTEITTPSDIKDTELSDSSTCRFSGKSTPRFSGKQKGGTWPAETGKDPAFTTQNCRFSGKTCDIPFLRMSPTKSCWSGCSLSSDDATFAGFFTGSEVVPSAIFCDHRQKWLGDHVTGDRAREIYFFSGKKFFFFKMVIIAQSWDIIAKLNLTDIIANWSLAVRRFRHLERTVLGRYLLSCHTVVCLTLVQGHTNTRSYRELIARLFQSGYLHCQLWSWCTSFHTGYEADGGFTSWNKIRVH